MYSHCGVCNGGCQVAELRRIDWRVSLDSVDTNAAQFGQLARDKLTWVCVSEMLYLCQANGASKTLPLFYGLSIHLFSYLVHTGLALMLLFSAIPGPDVA